MIGAITAILSAIMAATAYDLKRVLAYSTISQLAYMVYAVGVGDIFASQFHLLSHSLFKALLFLAAGAVIHSIGTRDMRLMGGLGRKMPFVRSMFIIGALALAGIPFFNGFWSKDAILAAGFSHGPMWAYLIMLIATGITAYYTTRCVWMVFLGEPRTEIHPHPVSPVMKASLFILAIGTLTSWGMGGRLAEFFEHSLPFHHFHPLSIAERFAEVFTFPMTYGTLLVIATGMVVYLYIKRVRGVVHEFRGIIQFAENGLGFDALNAVVSQVTIYTAEALRYTQTGVLNWNIFGMLLGMIAMLGLIEMGGL
jgi:NADH-quinone oxidoreductase subunit L